jgi:predicted NBD/HSP70 family sugar kinase
MNPESRQNIERPRIVHARQASPRAVYHELLRHDALTRGELASLTGLTRIAASASVDQLVDRGLALAVEAADGGNRGPAARRYALTPTAGYVVGAHIGPGWLTIAAADLTGHVAATTRVPFEEPADAVRMLHDAVTSCLRSADADRDKLQRVVLGSPGVIDPGTGEFAFATLLPSWKRTVTADLRRSLGRPVVFENDVNLAAMAEARFGAGRGVEHMVFMLLEEGLGLGLVLNGRLYRGRNGWAGEIGYLPAPLPASYTGVEGMPGSVHQLASAPAIGALAGQHGFGTDAAAAVRAATSAGASGEAFLDELARRTAIVVSSTCLLVDPSVLVLDGGHLAAGGEPLLDRIRAHVRLLSPTPVRLALAQVHDDPILRGALQTALDDARDSLFTA